MKQQRSLLVVAPHPDDETLGCGGTVAKRLQAGWDIHIAVVTDGCNLFKLGQWKIETDPTPAETSAMRKAETLCAVEILGCKKSAVRFLDFTDASLAKNIPAAADTLAKIIAEIKPAEIYVTSEHEYHSDHKATAEAVRLAMRQTDSDAKLLRYTVMLPDDMELSGIADKKFAEDISAQLELKRKASTSFNSHLKIVAEGQSEPIFENMTPWLKDTEIFLID